ncbi:hypothetical protein [Pseudogemmobacter sonorensis]|uniref:hypothetical protein n=1 Tax=Pseudogemmobacter sonorensis TaxID=2989681 RepID=UPI0036BB2C5D
MPVSDNVDRPFSRPWRKPTLGHYIFWRLFSGHPTGRPEDHPEQIQPDGRIPDQSRNDAPDDPGRERGL